MKTFKVKGIIACTLLLASAFNFNSIGVSAEWHRNNNGWWYSEGNSWATGWRKIDGYWYYFYSDGYMAKDTTVDGYKLGSDGAWIVTPPKASTTTTNNTGYTDYTDYTDYSIPQDAATFNGHYYKVYANSGMSWDEAKTYCESLGGHLATITSQEENSFLYNLVKASNAGGSAYFGGTDKDSEGTWRWITGEPFQYSNWHSGEPNNWGYDESYTMFYYAYTDGTWNDGGPPTSNAGSNSISFICEWDYGTSTTNTNSDYTTERQILANGNIAGVTNGPENPTTFTVYQPTVITYIQDYHYFNYGQLPGTISLRHSDGTIYGPWQTSGTVGQGGVENAYWEAYPYITIKAGTYTVIDSNPETWSCNYESEYKGFTLIKGY